MLSTDLRQGRSYRFNVIKELSTRKYFKVKTDDDVVFSLLKFRFQQNLPVPDYLDCYVKSLYPLTLGQDISIFIRDFYQENCDYEFKVKAVKTESTVYYDLEDEHELCFKLYNAPESIAIGSRIKCKVLKIKGVNVSLKYVGTLATHFPIDFLSISQWLDAIGIPKRHDKIKSLISVLPEFHASMVKYDRRDPSWIIELIHAVAHNITNWLISCKDNRKILAKTIRRMELARRIALFILEESDFLRNCDSEQRASLQSRLSECVELFEQYYEASAIIFDNTYEEFIDKIFSRLKKAGFLYQPSRQFKIMMTILKLRPELINYRMGELFEALHNWELSNWQTDPFREALVFQLQIFIKENCGIINILPANDSTEDNKAVIRMILAIAVQSILAKDNDSVDLLVNRAMLYRYISYLYPDNIHTLLGKASDAILGLEHGVEFVWNDTEHPTLLMEKASHPSPSTDERDNLVKIYATSKAMVQLRSGNISVIARNADADRTALPNGLIEWLNPKISIVDDVKTHSLRKTKDLKSYARFWDDISWSIFGEEETAGEVIEKNIPFGGEEVKVIIDDVRIFKNLPEKQRLQFHCTIYDDSYIGEGWMPCDAVHMTGWLSAKDIPGNYDGSLDFARDENGSPLLFPATVVYRDDKMEFSMKSQIEDALLENTGPGEESVCIVTHLDRHNNAWLCLSETGCTFKVQCDETTEHFFEGMLVRVRYVEPERSGSFLQFFIGEVSDNQDDIPFTIKKSQCLFNLMQSLGVENDLCPAENSEVVEVEEVMSREELLEIIYMFQRCAFAEKEYLKAFNYLGFASVLCRLVEDQLLLKQISSHMELLQLLQDFGRNQKVDNETLASCGEKIRDIPMLERLYTRLRIVANLDGKDSSEWLWNIRMNPRNDTEQQLASLVLSYNMIPSEIEKPRKELLKEIATLLNVNNTVSSSKYYGDESQTVEFKSSLIYSTHGGGRPEIREQLFEIVHTICGFMNARGGCLYIGVNDSGYENGLRDDLDYRQAHGMKATLDAMIVDLQNHLDRIMPRHAKDHWEISSDPESKKGVIVVRVLPVELPVEHEGVIYVRSSSTTKPRLGEQREEFIRTRSHNYSLLMKIWGVGQDVPASSFGSADREEDPVSEPEVTEEQELPLKSVLSHTPDSPQADVIRFEDETVDADRISTGKHRHNVLHHFESAFVTPAFYLYFSKDGAVTCSEDDSYYDYEPDCRLALAVNEREKNGMLVMTGSDSAVMRIDLAAFSGFSSNERRQLRTDSELSFVNIAQPDDYLISVVKSTSGAVFYRIDSISRIADARSFDARGAFLCEPAHRILAQDIVTEDKLVFFERDAVNKESRFYGIQIPKGDGTLTEQERINELLKPIAISD